MLNTRIVKVFLVSSINELDNDRIRIGDPISQDLTARRYRHPIPYMC